MLCSAVSNVEERGVIMIMSVKDRIGRLQLSLTHSLPLALSLRLDHDTHTSPYVRHSTALLDLSMLVSLHACLFMCVLLSVGYVGALTSECVRRWQPQR